MDIMNRISKLLLVALTVFTVPAQAQVTQQWVNRYDGPDDYSPYYDYYGKVVAVDAAGNVFVTGWSSENGTADYVTAKYDALGTEMWLRRYNGPGNGADLPYALAVDAAGNVYVTGQSVGSGTAYDYATVKYDTNGNEIWVRRYNHPENNNDLATALAVDAAGNVYVAGTSFGGYVEGQDFATVKYDTYGNELWVRRYNGPDSNHDGGSRSGVALAVDAAGNVAVTGASIGGTSWDSGTGFDYATVKYDTHGTELWARRYSESDGGYYTGEYHSRDLPYAVAMDAAGNVFVTGYSLGSGTSYKYATVKYDTHGTELWVRPYRGPGNGDNAPFALAVDAAGNVFVTGKSHSGPRYDDWDYGTIKYDTDGNELWVRHYNGPGNTGDAPYALAVDAAGSVFVAGYSEGSGTSSDFATVKYDTNGNDLWVRRYNGGGDDYAFALAVDAVGNVVVAGYSRAADGTFDNTTVKYADADVPPIDNTPPTLTCPSDAVFFATEPDGALATYPDITAWLTAAAATDSQSGVVSLMHNAPSFFLMGATPVTFSANDAAGNSGSCIVTLTVVNPPPVFSPMGSQDVNEAQTLNLTVSASDPNGNALTYAASGLPSGATFDPVTRNFSYTPGFDVSTRFIDSPFDVFFTVNDGTTVVSLPVRITVKNVNRPPVASAGVDQQMECAGSSCPITLVGTDSTDPDSTPGSQDDIAQYKWYKGYGAATPQLLGTGSTPVVILSLGVHEITLEVTDHSGAVATDTLQVILNPAQLSLYILDKAEVDWPKTAGELAEVKLHGRLALPVGVLLPEIIPLAAIQFDLAGQPELFSQTVNFQLKDALREKWEYKADPLGTGVRNASIHWKGAKFSYKTLPVDLETEFIALTQTALSINRRGADPVSLSVNGVTASIDGVGVVTASVPYEIDEDGEVTLTLPFELTPAMEINLTVGIQPSIVVRVGDYYTAGSGKFAVNAKVNVGILTGASRPADLGVRMALGNEGFPGSALISELEWAKLSVKEWKIERKN